MPDAWNRIKNAIHYIERRANSGGDTSVGLSSLNDMLEPDWVMEEPRGYAWGAMFTRYLNEADRCVLAAGPSVCQGPTLCTWAPDDLWMRALSIAERVGDTSPLVHKRTIVDLREDTVRRVSVPPSTVNAMVDSMDTRRNAAECMWVRLDDKPCLHPLAFAIIDGEMHAFDCSRVFKHSGELRRALQCATKGSVACTWSQASHLYRTAELDKETTSNEVDGRAWRLYNDTLGAVQSTAPAAQKVHNGIQFTWCPEGGFWLGQDGPLVHGLTALSCASVEHEVKPLVPRLYFTLAAMYRYFKENTHGQNAANLATDLFVRSRNFESEDSLNVLQNLNLTAVDDT